MRSAAASFGVEALDDGADGARLADMTQRHTRGQASSLVARGLGRHAETWSVTVLAPLKSGKCACLSDEKGRVAILVVCVFLWGAPNSLVHSTPWITHSHYNYYMCMYMSCACACTADPSRVIG